MKLTTRGRYAIQGLLDVMKHSGGRAVRLEDISQRQNISLCYLEQLFRLLRQGGVVRSVRGPGGGYILAEDPANIKVIKVLTSVNELLDFSLKLEKEAEGAANTEYTVVRNFAHNLSSAVTDVLNKSLTELQ